jgi:hypothetical protein
MDFATCRATEMRRKRRVLPANEDLAETGGMKRPEQNLAVTRAVAGGGKWRTLLAWCFFV